MENQNILIFQPVRTTWNQILCMRNTPLIQVSSTDSSAKKTVALLVNGGKRRVMEVAMIIATLFAALYSIISYPIRCYNQRGYEEAAVEMDLSRLNPDEMEEMKKMLSNYLFEKHKDVYGSLSTEEKDKLTRKVMSQAARSQKVYAPIIRIWVDHLLEEANKGGNKLVFMARDGIPFYRVATALMNTEEYKQKYPNLAKDKSIVLGYFSRNVVKSSEKDPIPFNRYVSEELGIQKGDRCFFVDIGFAGSMVDPIRKLLPYVDIDFKFLVATSNKAEGFLGNPANPLPNLQSAASNLGVRWVEESHHGNVASAEKIVIGDDNRAHPDVLYPKKVRCEEKYSTPYLLRKFCLRGVVDHALRLSKQSKEEALKAREVFSQTIGDIKGLKLPMYLGWDY